MLLLVTLTLFLFILARHSYHAPVPEIDARRAIRLIRSRLPNNTTDTHKVGGRFRSYKQYC